MSRYQNKLSLICINDFCKSEYIISEYSYNRDKSKFSECFYCRNYKSECTVCKTVHNRQGKTCSKKCEIKQKEITCMNNYGCKGSLHAGNIRNKWADESEKICGNRSPGHTKEAKENRLNTLKERYGEDVVNVFQAEVVKEKCKNTFIERYGVEHQMHLPETLDKIKETCLEKYNAEYYMKTDEFKEISKKVCLEKYGVENAAQSPEIYEKILKSSFRIEYFLDTNLYYQGSYELDFLNNYYSKIKIDNGISIEYEVNGKKSIYHPDFFCADFNLIVEIKSSYTYEKELDRNLVKRKACIDKGYNFIFIINKDYNQFEEIIKNEN